MVPDWLARAVAARHAPAVGAGLLAWGAPAATATGIAVRARREARTRTAAGEALADTEVLKLVAAGLSNLEIADRLVVTEETVKTHVSRILGKLGLRDWTQAVVAAYESGLVVPARGRG
jgi:DNA-binding CsgD family transcriptional regulator